MRHSSITLTMDTYGHLFPGQEADAVAKLPSMFRSDRVSTESPSTASKSDSSGEQMRGQLGGKFSVFLRFPRCSDRGEHT
jgi:hypothetical protein